MNFIAQGRRRVIALFMATLLASVGFVVFGLDTPGTSSGWRATHGLALLPFLAERTSGDTLLPDQRHGLHGRYGCGHGRQQCNGPADPWGYYIRNCTSFVSWKLSQQGFNTSGMGNATNWGSSSKATGLVNSTPAPGAVAWWAAGTYDQGYLIGSAGHVAYVDSVNSNGSVNIEEYNYGGTGQWHTRTITPGTSTEQVQFIHFADLSGSSGSSPPPPPSGASPIQNGGFNAGTSHWATSGTANLAYYTAVSGMGTNPYEGSGYAATNASSSGDSISETNTATIHTGDTWCASAEVVTIGNATGGSGTLAIWLTGGATNDSSTYAFSNLSGTNNWKPAKTCVTATTAQSYVKVQVYPTPGAPTIGLDAVDVHQTLNANGGFNSGMDYWNAQPGTNYVAYAAADNTGTNPYEGYRFGATNTATSGGSIYQDLPRAVVVGDTFCASAQVVTVGNTTGAAGALYVYLTGGTGTEESHSSFSGLPGGNSWSPIKTCVVATTAHSNIRVQLYPAVNGPTVGVDALDVHASIIQNGGFNVDASHWGITGGLSYMQYSNYNSTLPYEGSGFEVIQASSSSDSLAEARSWGFGVGDTFCASAEVITPGYGSGASGERRRSGCSEAMGPRTRPTASVVCRVATTGRRSRRVSRRPSLRRTARSKSSSTRHRLGHRSVWMRWMCTEHKHRRTFHEWRELAGRYVASSDDARLASHFCSTDTDSLLWELETTKPARWEQDFYAPKRAPRMEARSVRSTSCRRRGLEDSDQACATKLTKLYKSTIHSMWHNMRFNRGRRARSQLLTRTVRVNRPALPPLSNVAKCMLCDPYPVELLRNRSSYAPQRDRVLPCSSRPAPA